MTKFDSKCPTDSPMKRQLPLGNDLDFYFMHFLCETVDEEWKTGDEPDWSRTLLLLEDVGEDIGAKILNY